MTLAWPLPGGRNIAFGEMSLLSGALFHQVKRRALTGYASYWGHLESFEKYFPGGLSK